MSDMSSSHQHFDHQLIWSTKHPQASRKRVWSPASQFLQEAIVDGPLWTWPAVPVCAGYHCQKYAYLESSNSFSRPPSASGYGLDTQDTKSGFKLIKSRRRGHRLSLPPSPLRRQGEQPGWTILNFSVEFGVVCITDGLHMELLWCRLEHHSVSLRRDVDARIGSVEGAASRLCKCMHKCLC